MICVDTIKLKEALKQCNIGLQGVEGRATLAEDISASISESTTPKRQDGRRV
jgi:hypothetical protein